jgi:6-phosphogluconolactonase
MLVTAGEGSHDVYANVCHCYVTGLLTHVQTISTVPAAFAAESHCAEIKIHPSGNWVLAPNRGHDSVAVFEACSHTGRLTMREICPITDTAEGFSPQHIAFDTSGEHVYCGDGATLIHYYLDTNHGRLVRVRDYPCHGGGSGGQIGGYIAVDLQGAKL